MGRHIYTCAYFRGKYKFAGTYTRHVVCRPDDSRERMRAKCVDDVLVLTSGERELRARLLSADVKNLPHNEANRAFSVSSSL